MTLPSMEEDGEAATSKASDEPSPTDVSNAPPSSGSSSSTALVVAKSEGKAGGGAESGAVCVKIDDGLTEYERQLHANGLMIRVGMCGGKGCPCADRRSRYANGRPQGGLRGRHLSWPPSGLRRLRLTPGFTQPAGDRTQGGRNPMAVLRPAYFANRVVMYRAQGRGGASAFTGGNP